MELFALHLLCSLHSAQCVLAHRTLTRVVGVQVLPRLLLLPMLLVLLWLML